MDVTGLGAHDPHLHLRSCLRATWLHMCPAILAWALLAPSLPLAHGGRGHGSVCCHTGRDFTRQALCGQCQCAAVPAPEFVSVAPLRASLLLRPSRQAQRLFLRGTCVLCTHLCAWRGTCLAVPVYGLADACNEMTSICARSTGSSVPPSRAQGARTLTPPSLPISLAHTRTRMCTRTHTHTHTQNTFVYTSTHEHKHTLSHTRTHTCIHTHTHTNTHTHTHTRTHAHTRTHVHTHTCTHTHTHNHIQKCTHEQTRTPNKHNCRRAR